MENIRSILNTRYWSTDVFETVYFNDFVFYGLKSNILSEVNGMLMGCLEVLGDLEDL